MEGQGISKKEIELVQLIADGVTTKDIAKLKGISPRTIEAKTYLLRVKFNLRTNIGLIVLFFRKGLIK